MPFLFDWRKAVVSDQGPSSPTTRHVLLTLSLHMNEDGGSCFPSIATLMRETKLSNRAVITHLDLADADGWIERRSNTGTGQGWKLNNYQATMPDAVNEVHHVSAKGSEAGSPRRAKGSERRSKKVVNEVHTSTSVSTPEEGAVVAFCRMLGTSWDVKQPIDEWAAGLSGDYPGVAIAYELKKASEYHQTKGTKVRSPSKTIRNWLERAKPLANGGHSLSAQHVRPEELE